MTYPDPKFLQAEIIPTQHKDWRYEIVIKTPLMKIDETRLYTMTGKRTYGYGRTQAKAEARARKDMERVRKALENLRREPKTIHID